MDKLLRIAGGDAGLMDEAFRCARAEPGKPPLLHETFYYIMEQRGYADFVARMRTGRKRLTPT